MPAFTENLFWISLFIIFYTYAGYALLLIIIVSIKKLFNGNSDKIIPPAQPVTIIVAAYNEEAIIEEKIRNTFSLDYPANLLQLIFITDGSTDKTPSITRNYPRIKLLHQPERKGKLAAMNRAMQFVTTEFVIFSDANTLLNKDCIQLLLAPFADHRVGGVAGEKKIVTQNADGTVSQGEGLYWKYESFLKYLDSELYSIVGAAGELFAIRSSLYTHLPENIILDDFVQSLLLCSKGHVVLYEPAAMSVERASLSVKDEMERKIRITAGGFQAIGILKQLFNPFRYPVLFFQFLSHRILRWTLCPLALVFLFLSGMILFIYDGAAFYRYSFVLQIIFYVMGFAGWYLSSKNRSSGLFYLPFYFLFMNFCVFAGFIRFLGNRQGVIWKKAARPGKI